MNKILQFNTSITELIQKRYSCRTHLPRPLTPKDVSELSEFIKLNPRGPFGNQIRTLLTAAAEDDSTNLKKLGTYGFIKDPAGFLIGVTRDRSNALEDFGYLMETYILKATELGIGSCWLGGTFTKSRFSKAAKLKEGERIPSVVSLGYPANQQAWIDRVARVYAGADRRHHWNDLFFDQSSDQVLSKSTAGDYETILEMVRLAPSASNKQPWRIVKFGADWHFYLQRTSQYPQPVIKRLLGIADLQRIDMGIAMAHFDLSAKETGQKGNWVLDQPDLGRRPNLFEYTATWRERD